VKLIVSPEAVADLREIEEFIGNDNAKAAVDFVSRLTERFSELVDFPGVGRKRDYLRPNYRSVSEGEYIIFYRVRADAVEILHVLHGKRDLPKIFGKDEIGVRVGGRVSSE